VHSTVNLVNYDTKVIRSLYPIVTVDRIYFRANLKQNCSVCVLQDNSLVRVYCDFLSTFIDRLVVGESFSQSSFYSEKWIFCDRTFRRSKWGLSFCIRRLDVHFPLHISLDWSLFHLNTLYKPNDMYVHPNLSQC